MRDEFNHGSEAQNVSDYSMPVEEQCSVEFRMPVEVSEAEEVRNTTEYDENTEAILPQEDEERRRAKKKKKLMAYMVASAAAVVVVSNTVSYEPALTVEETGQWGYENHIYEERPQLPNLMQNGPITLEEYGIFDTVLDEEFLIYGQDGKDNVLLAGKQRANLNVSEGTESIYYDYDSNTLYLDNCDIDYINANMLGNGFTIDVNGICHVGAVLSWGFHHGGSITFTGEEGTLYVNRDGVYDIGVEVRGENSMSGIFIDRMEGFYVGGSMPIVVSETTMPHALYWKTKSMHSREDLSCDRFTYSGDLADFYYTSADGSRELAFLPVESVE